MADDSIRDVVLASASDSLYGLMQPSGLTVNKTVYAHEESSSVEAAVLEIRQGVLKIPSTSTNLSSTLSFTIQNSKIQDIYYIKGALTLPQWCVLKSMWFLDAIDNVQIQIPGSGNIQYDGASWKDFLLRTSSKDQRNALNDFMPYVAATAGATTTNFVCPVVTPWSSNVSPQSAFPLDADSLSNNVILSVTLKPAYQWIFATQSGGAHVRVLPTAFDSLELKPLNLVSHVKDQLSIGRMRELYRIPTYYLQSYKLSGVALTGAQQSLTLQQMPNAQLVSILIRVEDDSKYMSSDNAAASQALVNPVNIRLSQLRLNFNGLDLIDLSDKEISLMHGSSAIGYDGGLSYTTYTSASNSVTTSTAYDQNLNVLECFILNNGKALSECEYALSKNFNGYTMTLFFTAPAAVASSTVTITYVCNAVMDIQNGIAQYHF